MSEHLWLGGGPEFDRIRGIYARLGTAAYGLGDDCALLRADKATIALSIDLSIEGVHFRREWLSPAQIGYRAAVAALSDLYLFVRPALKKMAHLHDSAPKVSARLAGKVASKAGYLSIVRVARQPVREAVYICGVPAIQPMKRRLTSVHAETIPDFSETEKINRSIYNTNHDRTLAEIVAEADRAYADFVALIQSLSEEDLAQPARFSDQEPRSLAAQIMGNGYEHPIFHYAERYRRRGDLAKALQLHEQSVAAVADWPEWYGTARYNLACFYALNGQKEKALHELREALQLRPDLSEWSKQDTDLASLHDDPAFSALYM